MKADFLPSHPRQLFRPEYGSGLLRISPKRWWSRTDRRSAYVASQILDASDQEISETVKEEMHREALDALIRR